jgi:hypothetical protein
MRCTTVTTPTRRASITRFRRAAALALLLMAGAGLTACGSDTGTGDQTSGRVTTSSSSPTTCVGASTSGSVTQDPTAKRRLPDPPPGARACGRDPRLRATRFVTQTPVGRDLLEYYGPALRARDCETDAITASSGLLAAAGELQLSFSCPDGEGAVVAPERGSSYVIAWRG